ncbi:MAG TPA: HIT family protein [Hyphomicrobiaceae bacterium]|nr:HIT family protein [Hyphomicrobiaceae bacterium]
MSGTTCLFCRIGAKAIPAVVVHEDADTLAFLDIEPLRPGHTLIIPKLHLPYFDALPEPLAMHMMRLGQNLARALKSVHGVDRVGFFYSGGDIAHVHAHVVPLHEKHDITSRRYIAEDTLTFRPPPRAPREALEAEAVRIRARLAVRT